jgi:transmembrane sensor
VRLGLVPQTRGMTANEAAAHWLARQDRGMGPSDEAEFERWRHDPAHAEAYARARALMDLFDIDDGTDPNLRALRQSALQAAPEPRPAWRWAAAAAVIAVVGTGLATIALDTHAPHHSSLIASLGGQARNPAVAAPPAVLAPAGSAIDYATDIGERRTIRLSDGTRVTLNTGTRIAVAFDKGRRLVRLLRGQALFEVAHNAHWPFTVEAADRQVTALGTVFEVSAYPGRLHVLLVRGRVIVERASDAPPQSPGVRVASAILRPGQSLTAELGAPQQISMTDVSSQLMWRDGFVEFNDDTLSEAVSEINRYVRTPIEIGDDGAASLHVSGVFRTGSADRFVAAVGQVLPIEARTMGDGHIQLSMAKATDR